MMKTLQHSKLIRIARFQLRCLTLFTLSSGLVLAQSLLFTDSFEVEAQAGEPGEVFFKGAESKMQGQCYSDNSFGVSFGDFNFDGWTDMMTLSHSHSNVPGYESSAVHCVWLNNDGASFSHDQSGTDALSEVPGITCTWSAQVTDFTGDGKPDVWCRGSEAGSDFYRNTTNNPGESVTFEHTDGWLSESDNGYKDEFRFFDFDGDGNLERLNDDGIVRSVLTGQITFDSGLDKPDTFDMDGDGFADIWSQSSAKTLRNDRNGGFEQVNYDSDLNVCNSWNTFHDDFDKDNDTDLICVVSNPRSQMHFLRNDGDFQFTKVNTTNITLGGLGVDKGVFNLEDFDNDAQLDLIYTWGSFHLYQQTQDFNFDHISGSDLADKSYEFFYRTAADDYNNDGLIDVALAVNEPSAKASSIVFENITQTDNRYVAVILKGDEMGAGNNVNGQGAVIVATKPGSSQIINSVLINTNWRDTGPNFRFHLGVGTNENVDLKVIWPSGFESSQLFQRVATNQTYRVTYKESGADTLTTWTPGNGW